MRENRADIFGWCFLTFVITLLLFGILTTIDRHELEEKFGNIICPKGTEFDKIKWGDGNKEMNTSSSHTFIYCKKIKQPKPTLKYDGTTLIY